MLVSFPSMSLHSYFLLQVGTSSSPSSQALIFEAGSFETYLLTAGVHEISLLGGPLLYYPHALFIWQKAVLPIVYTPEK